MWFCLLPGVWKPKVCRLTLMNHDITRREEIFSMCVSSSGIITTGLKSQNASNWLSHTVTWPTAWRSSIGRSKNDWIHLSQCGESDCDVCFSGRSSQCCQCPLTNTPVDVDKDSRDHDTHRTSAGQITRIKCSFSTGPTLQISRRCRWMRITTRLIQNTHTRLPSTLSNKVGATSVQTVVHNHLSHILSMWHSPLTLTI